MIAPVLPADEAERLIDLRALELLDTPPEERFDRIVQLARGVFGVPIAYIALVDADRQWFKAKCGISAVQTGRAESFCGHAILGEGPMIVPDATLDDRFHDNPLVVGSPHIRFYAGYPLAGPNGHNVGTLCLADTQPRTLSEQQLGVLESLAHMAEHEMSLLDLVRAQRGLLEAQEALAASQRRLARELRDAAAFVRSVLPGPLDVGTVSAGHRLAPCSELGGDMLGIAPLDDGRRIAFFVLDVAGHGVGSSLLSVTAGNALRLRSLPAARFDDPASVLAALNRGFPTEATDGKFMTVWYGVYDPAERTLTYSSAGHHPAVLLRPGSAAADLLGTPGPLVGLFDAPEYANASTRVEPGSLVWVFSDGAFEVCDTAGDYLGFDGLLGLLAEERPADGAGIGGHADRLERLEGRIRAHADGPLADDLTILEVAFR
jgi:phosphoserine phosphatase RsbU/P